MVGTYGDGDFIEETAPLEPTEIFEEGPAGKGIPLLNEDPAPGGIFCEIFQSFD